EEERAPEPCRRDGGQLGLAHRRLTQRAPVRLRLLDRGAQALVHVYVSMLAAPLAAGQVLFDARRFIGWRGRDARCRLPARDAAPVRDRANALPQAVEHALP